MELVTLINLQSLIGTMRIYYENKNYLNDIFDILSQQINTMYKFMDKELELFIGDKSTLERIQSLEYIRKSEENQSLVKLNEVFSLGSFLIVVVFGLPTINSTVDILREMIPLEDIPFISKTGLSFCFWLVTIIFLGIRMYRVKLLNKNAKSFKGWY